MNKDFWEHIDRLEELARNIPDYEWYYRSTGIDRFAIFSKSKPEMIIATTCIDEDGYKIGLSQNDAAYISAANPVMINKMITKLRQLEKEANWLANYLAGKCVYCDSEKNYSTLQEWREAARKAVEKSKE